MEDSGTPAFANWAVMRAMLTLDCEARLRLPVFLIEGRPRLFGAVDLLPAATVLAFGLLSVLASALAIVLPPVLLVAWF